MSALRQELCNPKLNASHRTLKDYKIRLIMSDLYTDDLSRVKLSDLENFLCLDRPKNQRPPEGATLDYKKELIADLGNDVAALANKYGGLILLGVGNDGEDKNLPSALVGAELGSDPVARITDKIVATVYPRPEFDIRTFKIEKTGKLAAIIRVREGAFPPYEYSQGATVRQPVRIQETTGQASLKELETLFAKRAAFGRPASELLKPLRHGREIMPLIEDGTSGAYKADPFYNFLFVVPRSPGRLRLDSKFEHSFEQLIVEVFRPDPFFCFARGKRSIT